MLPGFGAGDLSTVMFGIEFRNLGLRLPVLKAAYLYNVSDKKSTPLTDPYTDASQPVFDANGKKKEVSRGRVAMSAPRNFRWAVADAKK